MILKQFGPWSVHARMCLYRSLDVLRTMSEKILVCIIYEF